MFRSKKIGLYLLFFLILNIECPSLTIDIHVIGVRRVGFFASFFRVLNNLDWCKKTGAIPVVYWHSKCLYWQEEAFNRSFNAWEYYFEPVSSQNYPPGYCIHDNFQAFDAIWPYWISLPQAVRNRASALVSEYIKVKPYVLEIVNKFFEKHFNNCVTIGIHLRGTDKYLDVKPVDPIVILNVARMYAEKFQDHLVKFFVASDEQRLVDLAIEQLAGYEVVVYPAYRSTTGEPIHLSMINNKAQRGLEVLVDALLLSRCSVFIHTSSNVSNAVLVFNPQLQNLESTQLNGIGIFVDYVPCKLGFRLDAENLMVEKLCLQDL